MLFFFCPYRPVPAVPAEVVAGYDEVRSGSRIFQFLDVWVLEFSMWGGLPAVLADRPERLLIPLPFPGLDAFRAFGAVLAAAVPAFPVPDYRYVVEIGSADLFYIRLFLLFIGKLSSAFPAAGGSHIINAVEQFMAAGSECKDQRYNQQGGLHLACQGGLEEGKDPAKGKQ